MIALLMMLADNSFVTFTTGQELLAVCKKDHVACQRYIEGGSDMIAGLQASRAVPTTICVGPDVTSAKLVADVTSFLAANPDHLDEAAGGLLWAALYDAFPCPSHGG
jgi:hypothetical protein